MDYTCRNGLLNLGRKQATPATFDERIYDGLAYFNPGDYVHEYNVTVE